MAHSRVANPVEGIKTGRPELFTPCGSAGFLLPFFDLTYLESQICSWDNGTDRYFSGDFCSPPCGSVRILLFIACYPWSIINYLTASCTGLGIGGSTHAVCSLCMSSDDEADLDGSHGHPGLRSS